MTLSAKSDTSVTRAFEKSHRSKTKHLWCHPPRTLLHPTSVTFDLTNTLPVPPIKSIPNFSPVVKERESDVKLVPTGTK